MYTSSNLIEYFKVYSYSIIVFFYYFLFDTYLIEFPFPSNLLLLIKIQMKIDSLDFVFNYTPCIKRLFKIYVSNEQAMHPGHKSVNEWFHFLFKCYNHLSVAYNYCKFLIIRKYLTPQVLCFASNREIKNREQQFSYNFIKFKTV